MVMILDKDEYYEDCSLYTKKGVWFVKRSRGLWLINKMLNSVRNVIDLTRSPPCLIPESGCSEGGEVLWVPFRSVGHEDCLFDVSVFQLPKGTEKEPKLLNDLTQCLESLLLNEWRWSINVSYNLSNIYLSVYFVTYPTLDLPRVRALEDRDTSTPHGGRIVQSRK